MANKAKLQPLALTGDGRDCGRAPPPTEGGALRGVRPPRRRVHAIPTDAPADALIGGRQTYPPTALRTGWLPRPLRPGRPHTLLTVQRAAARSLRCTV